MNNKKGEKRTEQGGEENRHGKEERPFVNVRGNHSQEPGGSGIDSGPTNRKKHSSLKILCSQLLQDDETPVRREGREKRENAP